MTNFKCYSGNIINQIKYLFSRKGQDFQLNVVGAKTWDEAVKKMSPTMVGRLRKFYNLKPLKTASNDIFCPRQKNFNWDLTSSEVKQPDIKALKYKYLKINFFY